MALQLPEPDYYTLAEVAKKWERSEDVLLRLGAERKVEMCIRPADEIAALTIKRKGGPLTLREAIDMNYMAFPDDEEFEDIESWYDNVEYFHSEYLLWVDIFSLMQLRDGIETADVYSIFPLNSDKMYPKGCEWLTHVYFKVSSLTPLRISKNDLLIRSAEIHRIEDQHESAEKAAADDVLGTKEKETMQAIIAAFTHLQAESAPQYRNGEKPNASRIAEKLAPLMPGRTPQTIRKVISEATKAGLI